MAHSSFHFLIGLCAGSIAFAPILIKPLRRNRPLAIPLRNWLGLSYATAILAIIPNLLSFAGVPSWICSGWWMNLFILHPMINRWQDGGMLIGELGIAAIFTLQYSVLMLTIIRAGRVNRQGWPRENTTT